VRVRRRIGVGSLVLALLLAIPSLASEHADETPHAALAAGTALLGAAGVGLAAGRRRDAAALALAMLLGVSGLEAAVHSVHHLADPESGASCQVLSATQHVTGALAETAALCAPARLVEALPAVGPTTILPPRFSGPDEGRAPPVPPSA